MSGRRQQANDIQSLQGASSSPASDAVGGLGSTLQNVLQNVNTAISDSGNGLGSGNGGFSGTANLPITPAQNLLGPVVNNGAQFNLNPFGVVV
jgi:hypothetical protein